MCDNILRNQQVVLLKEEIIVTTQLRNAAGVCALSIGLLVCSSAGAIAYADQTDNGGAAAGTPSGSSTTGDNTTTSTGTVSAVSQKQDDSNKQDDEESDDGGTLKTTSTLTTNLTNPQTLTSELEVQTNSSTAGGEGEDDLGAATLDVQAQDVEVGTPPTSIVETPPTEAITPTPLVLTPPPSGSNNKPQAPANPAERESLFAQAAKSAANKESTPKLGEHGAITKTVVFPVTDAVVSIARALGQVTFTLAQLPTSKTPVTDVIVSVSVMVGTVVGAVVEVAQVPGDLVALLGNGSVGIDRPPLVGAGGAVDRVVHTPANPPPLGFAALPPSQLPVVIAEAPLVGAVVQPSNIGGAATSGLKNDLTLSGLAPVPSGISPATTSFLDHVVSSVLVPASLTALAAIAIPGVAGLLIVCVAGIRVGYRQAKAGLALRVSGIARFAGPGPMGVVRSGGLIALHTRTPRLGKQPATRAARAKTANAPRLLESVA